MRDINREAWFLNYLTSIPYYEACAQATEDFADLFNRLLTKHDGHGIGNLDGWVSRYLSHAEEIRRRIEFVRYGDYMPMYGQLSDTDRDFRGLAEQNIYGWRTQQEDRAWNMALEHMSNLCGVGAQALGNAYRHGKLWGNEQTNCSGRNEGFSKGATYSLGFWQARGLIPVLEQYPKYEVDYSLSCKTGEVCPRNGVWVPQQVLSEGLEHLHLEFVQQGRLMHPLFRFHLEKYLPEYARAFAEMDGVPIKEEDYLEEAVSVPEEAIWHPLVLVSDPISQPIQRGRIEAKQPCPRTGYWWTLAQTDSRRRFSQGEVMPDFTDSRYGSTIWYWDEDQQDH
ncbi:hypothetical protein DLM_1619 [Aquitalea magnusonii]|uniref:Uncharacterized protein n=1 Tax=Aquitalea magnusonii TaxID=332411 RepID=A0A3G9GBI5_9NEIS|nr:hypothetical protein [Aquitalea magnusonii]BBF85238.1 hypothetical protein DLM_1619 [Aquitalea magnusonii]